MDYFKVQILDNQGNIVPTADNSVTFKIQGEGTIIGVDNGNPRSHESFKAEHRKAFNGLCLAIVQSSKNAGKIRLTAHADGLKEASLEIETKAPTVVIPEIP